MMYFQGNRSIRIVLIFLASFWLQSNSWAQDYYRTAEGTIHFKSDAPLELIEASSKELSGIINPKDNTFAFVLKIRTFEGFNSPLQREHFNENYLESRKYPEATFSGRIIEGVDLSQPGKYTIRAKGKLNIHGVEQERIIKSEVVSSDGHLGLTSSFTVLLEEHNISIPKIVYQKIAEEIQVEIRATLLK